MDFPQYRKYPGGRSFFRILAEDRFDEVQLVGQRALLHTKTATIYPDKLLIADMLANTGGHWEHSSQAEFDQAMQRVSK